MTADVSAAASTLSPYWVYYESQWLLYGGTSFASPVWAGLIATINSYRVGNDMEPVGYLNHMLYTTPAVQATFRDITVGGTAYYNSAVGWDPPTGWGTPDCAAFAATVPSP
jgi:kumamolisin